MIHKVIATFPCGTKIIRNRPDWILRFTRGLRIDKRRPHLIQAFGYDFTKDDLDDINKDFKYCAHPLYGQITVNGEFI